MYLLRLFAGRDPSFMVTLSKATFLDPRFVRDLAAIGQAVEVDILSAEQKVTDDVSSLIEKNSEFYFCSCLNQFNFIDKKLITDRLEVRAT